MIFADIDLALNLGEIIFINVLITALHINSNCCIRFHYVFETNYDSCNLLKSCGPRLEKKNQEKDPLVIEFSFKVVISIKGRLEELTSQY